MIKKLHTFELTSENDVYLTKIKSNFLCYDSFDFCNTYHQEGNAYIGLLDSAATLYAHETADFSEIAEFLKALGVQYVFCSKNQAFKLSKCEIESGKILKYGGQKPEKELDVTSNPNYKTVFSRLDWNENMPDYNSFVSDLSFRIAHSGARIIQSSYGDIFTGWETEDSAVISAITIDKAQRGKGAGSILLKSLISSLYDDKKSIFVYCDCPIRERFYQKNDFYTVGEYAVAKI